MNFIFILIFIILFSVFCALINVLYLHDSRYLEKSNKITKVKGIRQFTGLMFRTRATNQLLFELKQPKDETIHSFFVFFDFKAIWYDENKVKIEERVIKPFQSNIKINKKWKYLLEIPI